MKASTTISANDSEGNSWQLRAGVWELCVSFHSKEPVGPAGEGVGGRVWGEREDASTAHAFLGSSVLGKSS